jgi:hypothetical protein
VRIREFSLRFDGLLGRNLTRGNTGRAVCVSNANYDRARNWAALRSREELIAHSDYQEFTARIVTEAQLLDEPCALFRGVFFDNDTPRRSDEMGPPPENKKILGGRYNLADQRVLYLCDSEEGVLRECVRRDLGVARGVLRVQPYQLPVTELRIVDFTKVPTDSFIAAVFSIAEDCNEDDYTFSQTVAEAVSARFDGMRVPGVRGDVKDRYSNVVVFRPGSDWRKWLEPGATPSILCRG